MSDQFGLRSSCSSGHVVKQDDCDDCILLGDILVDGLLHGAKRTAAFFNDYSYDGVRSVSVHHDNGESFGWELQPS